MNIKKKKHTNVGGLVDKPDFDHIETTELDIEEFLNRFKRGASEMIKKATEKPREVEYMEFKGYENFKELSEFVNLNFPIFKLTVNKHGQELIETDKGTFQVGDIFYRYLNPKTGTYTYDVMSKNKFFLMYE